MATECHDNTVPDNQHVQQHYSLIAPKLYIMLTVTSCCVMFKCVVLLGMLKPIEAKRGAVRGKRDHGNMRDSDHSEAH